MGTLYENIMDLCEKRGIKGGKMCTEAGISKGLLTDLKMGRRTGISAVTAQKIASYFGVSVGYLLGEEAEKVPTETGGHKYRDDEILFALSRGGEGEITDAMFEEVRNFAAYVAQRESSKKKE